MFKVIYEGKCDNRQHYHCDNAFCDNVITKIVVTVIKMRYILSLITPFYEHH
jgi:hypothetical protein